MNSNDSNLNVFNQFIFNNTLVNAFDTAIDTITKDDDYRKELKSRFLSMINTANQLSITQTCDGTTKDDTFPYYYAVVNAKSFGKYLIPTYKPKGSA